MNRSHNLAFLSLALLSLALATPALAQSNVAANHKYAWQENCGWINFRDAGSPIASQGVVVRQTYLSGYAWGENIGWINFGDGTPGAGMHYANPTSGTVIGIPDFGVNRDPSTGRLFGYAWGENVGWINFSGGALATPAQPARVDVGAARLRGYAWGENIGWINLDDANAYIGLFDLCATVDFNNDGDTGTDADIEAFFACLAGSCCATCPGNADFNADGDVGTDADIEAFFRVLAGGNC